MTKLMELRRPTAPEGYVMVLKERAILYINGCQVVAYGLSAGGIGMGFAVSQAHALRSADFTALGGTPGWPESWGWTLFVLGVLSAAPRPLSLIVNYYEGALARNLVRTAGGRRVLESRFGSAIVHRRLIRLFANWHAAVRTSAIAMGVMGVWYAVFAASLILGRGAYGQWAYLTLCGCHVGFGYLVWRTDGFSSSTPGVS